MNLEEFEKHAHEMVDWMVDYYKNLRSFPVKSQVTPGSIKEQIPDGAPENGEPFEDIIRDVNNIIMPGITHWQHPNFHAYFPGNSSFPSLLGEMMTSTIAAQCMIWETSPAAAELEEKMMDWFKEMMALPSDWFGVIQDTASTATLVALLSARESVTGFSSNKKGLSQTLRVYASSETHSSIEKAVKIAGIGSDNFVKIEVDANLSMIPKKLSEAIRNDREKGYLPMAVVSTLGTTSTLAFDPLNQIAEICSAEGVWHHIDAAYAGSAFVLEEYQHLLGGIEKADSYLFNPHKWLFTNFDCTAYFVKDKETLLKTFEILPEYLKTGTRGIVNDYRDWGIQLGRRFRALKLWFVLRTYGVNGLKERLREHISYAEWLSENIKEHPNLELVIDPAMNVLVFRFIDNAKSEAELERYNQEMINDMNASGEVYLTHTRIQGKFAIRVVIGQTYFEKSNVEKLWDVIIRKL